jgi:catechol 2,3-dioxygenase-like lactoylglutathione lyase family enzyme
MDGDVARGDQFEVSGVHHLALVSRDMARTVHFYRDVLGFPLVRTIDLPGGAQHFFFDIGGGDTIAFFWFPKHRDAVPGSSAPKHFPGDGDFATAVGSMNHVAITVPADKIEEYRDRLRTRGVTCTDIMNHDHSESQIAKELHDGVWLRSIYFWDPDGALLEFAAWTKPWSAADRVAEPRNEHGEIVVMGTTTTSRAPIV